MKPLPHTLGYNPLCRGSCFHSPSFFVIFCRYILEFVPIYPNSRSRSYMYFPPFKASRYLWLWEVSWQDCTFNCCFFSFFFLFFCSSADYLRITNENNQAFGTYCGQKTGQNVIVNGEHALLTFHSDFALEEIGFQISFTNSKCNLILVYNSCLTSLQAATH